jgi:hypothetical protein
MVYDVRGTLIKVLVNETKEAGYYTNVFDGKGLASGIYIYQLRANDLVSSKKMIVLK